MDRVPHGVGDLLRGDADAEAADGGGVNVGDLGLRPQWLDVDDADLLPSPFQAERLGEAGDEELGRLVGGDVGLAVDRGGRGHVDQGAAAAQVRERGPGAEHHAEAVDVEETLHVGNRG